MNKVLEVIGALTLGSALVGGGMLYGGALGVIAATDKKTAEKTFYGKVLAKAIGERKARKLYISYVKAAEKEINENLINQAAVPADKVIKELREVEKKINEKFKDRDAVSVDEIAKEVHKELGLDKTDKWPFFSMTEEEQR